MLSRVNQILNNSAVIVGILLLTSANALVWGQEDDQIVIDVTEIDNNTSREEVQRYMGYEDLLYRYLTLPYDVNQNVNQSARHVDSGFVYLAIIPLLLLVLVYRRKKWFYGLMGMSILYLGMAMHYGKLIMSDGSTILVKDHDWSHSLQAVDVGFGGYFLLWAHRMGSLVSRPLRMVLHSITGEKDHITYAAMILLCLALLYFVVRPSFINRPRNRLVLIVIVTYFFVWWLLAGGIIWYGFLLFPLLLALIAKGTMSAHHYLSIHTYPIFRQFCIGGLIVWVTMAYVARISYVDSYNINETTTGSQIASEMLMMYAVGLVTAEECRMLSSPQNMVAALQAINSDERLVYRVGTHLEFDINHNSRRVLEDNTLGIFFEYYMQYRDKEAFIDFLISRGYGYFIVDLNTPQLDRTPDRTLIKKYQLLLSHLHNNSKARLIATDRVVTITDSQGSSRQVFGVVGETYIHHGTYAVYELIW